jgi:hypothetical protein
MGEERQAPGAEYRGLDDLAHGGAQLAPLAHLAHEVNRQIEPAGNLEGGLGDALPTFHMAAGLRLERKVDQHPHTQGLDLAGGRAVGMGGWQGVHSQNLATADRPTTMAMI